MTMTDLEDQDSEVCALESIYTPDEIQFEKKDGKISGTFLAFVSIPKGFYITYRLLEEVEVPDGAVAKAPVNIINLSHLPPITLTFKLPQNYPSNQKPDYCISCPYLNYRKLKLLARKLDNLWTENKGMVILYIWAQFLKEESLSFLNIEESLDITGFYATKSQKKNYCISNNDRRNCKKKNRNTSSKVLIAPIPNVYLHEYLKDYSFERKEAIFLKEYYTCGICFTEKKGADCIKFMPCDHVVCKDCVKIYFETRIMEGNAHSMPCPENKCNSEATQSQIRECVGPTLYSRYERQLLQDALDKMEDVTYCPRSSCGCAVIRENELLAICPSCQYTFCTLCKKTSHGIQSCFINEETKLKLIKEYEKGDEKIKLKLEKHYGKKQIAKWIAEENTKEWISANSKPCPKCRTAIEKKGGCSKMTCRMCHTNFCWLCLVILDTTQPYNHYLNPDLQCNLFPDARQDMF